MAADSPLSLGPRIAGVITPLIALVLCAGCALFRPPTPPPTAIEAPEPLLLIGRYVRPEVKGVFLVRPDGTGAHRILADLDVDLRAPAWSSDGSRIAFVYWGAGGAKDGEIWTSLAGGTDAAKLFDGSPGCSGAFYPAWSPDDTKIAFVCFTPGTRSSLSLYDLRTGEIDDLVSLTYPEVLDNPARWSPDGSTIAFDILHWGPTDDVLDGSLIATVDVTSKEVRRITAPGDFFAYPSWRPDGAALAVNTYDLGNMTRTDHASNIYELGVDGAVLRQITTDSVDGTYRITQPSWAPSAQQIWVTLWRPGEQASVIHAGWVDPMTGVVTDINLEGNSPQMRPVP